MICYRDRSYCADHANCATMECEQRLTTHDRDYLTRYPYIPVAYMSMKDQCGKWKEKK